MTDLEILLCQEAARLLNEQLVDVVVGFEAETAPLRPQPVFINSGSQAKKLIINGFCQNNLANYLTRFPRDQRIGMLVRGCESRAVRALVIENQHAREKLFLIGVPCHGIIDIKKIQGQFLSGQDLSCILAAKETKQTIIITTLDGRVTLERQAYLHDSCRGCLHPNPIDPDVMLGEPLPEGAPGYARQRITDFEASSPEKRYAFFVHEAERCIRCYACREACPMCYCAECFVDHTTPRWIESTVSPAGTHAWQIMRAFHQAGRCVSCGACERACPMDIKMTYLTDKLNEDMREMYGFEAGMSDTAQPPFAEFTLDDKDRFTG
jgi:formate dehydrogenase (coenzyme F420) beta subunit